MNILLLSQLLPYPLDTGPKTRAYYVLRYLSQHHAVTLLAFTRPDDPPQALKHLQSYCNRLETVPMVRSGERDAAAMLRSLWRGKPFLIERDSVPEMLRKVKSLMQSGEFAAVHADQLWMAQYALLAREAARAAGKSKPRLVLDAHNATFQIVQRLARGATNPLQRLGLEIEARRMKRWEGQVLQQFDQVVTVTEEDRRTLEALFSPPDAAPRFTTIPICVEAAAVPPVQPLPDAREVLHLGTMFWPPNIEGMLWFIQQVWPRVRERAPQAKLTIAGKNPPKALTRLDGEAQGIQVLGYVPDPQPLLQRAAVFIVPLLSGGGMRVKIVDGWRWGLPIVSTRLGAEGLRFRAGEHLLLADTPEAFAAAVLRVLTDNELAQRLRENGRRWMEQNYDWQRVYPAWKQIYPLDTDEAE